MRGRAAAPLADPRPQPHPQQQKPLLRSASRALLKARGAARLGAAACKLYHCTTAASPLHAAARTTACRLYHCIKDVYSPLLLAKHSPAGAALLEPRLLELLQQVEAGLGAAVRKGAVGAASSSGCPC